MIDMHTHILPEIDDGAVNIKETLEMIQEASKARIYRHFCNVALYRRRI